MISLGVCVALPVLVVWIGARMKTNSDNRRAEVLIKAIESNNAIDADKLAEAMSDSKKSKTPFEKQVSRLTRGCICTFLGVAFNVVSLVMYLSEGKMDDNEYTFLIAGCVLMAIGISFIIVYLAVRSRQKSLEARSESPKCEIIE